MLRWAAGIRAGAQSRMEKQAIKLTVHRNMRTKPKGLELGEWNKRTATNASTMPLAIVVVQS